ncbi:MAG: hypothetical protein FWG72_00580 [Oscillospiraceae bacterium]|nr:hypothetical protein [Oscillospiraceae bacterium]
MSEIIRHDVNEECAYSGMVEAGGFVFVSFCACDGSGSAESQINRVFAHEGLLFQLDAIAYRGIGG